MITVAKDNSGDFDSIQKAVDSVSDNNNETIFIKKGIYKERIEIRKNNITLIGEDTDETIITEGFYAKMIMPDGSKRGTFRSYTFLVYADNFSASNITSVSYTHLDVYKRQGSYRVVFYISYIYIFINIDF